jgi:hypothetical protein
MMNFKNDLSEKYNVQIGEIFLNNKPDVAILGEKENQDKVVAEIKEI